MSIAVMTWVWTHSQSRNGARLVLLAIADCASDDGGNAWPSINTIRRKANLKSDRTVQAAIKELVDLGELKVRPNAGPNGVNRFTVVMRTPAEFAPPQNLHPAEFAGVETEKETDTVPQDPPQNLHPANSAPPQNSASTPANIAGEPSLNHPEKKTSSSSKRSTRSAKDEPELEHPRFAEFWAAYPKKAAKPKAIKIFNRVVANGHDPDAIIRAAARYRADPQRNPNYTAHPTTWLNDERWDDQPAEPPPDTGLFPPPKTAHQPYQGQTDPNAYSGGLR